jgi:hypothetical protein
MVFSRVGPNQSIEWGQIRISKSKAMNPDVTILSVGELKSKDDASGSYERFSNKGCHSTLDHGDIRATCWEDSEVWLYDRDDKRFLQSFK